MASSVLNVVLIAKCRSTWHRETGPESPLVVWDPAVVIFGDSLRAAVSCDPTKWIAGSLRGRPGTVGALVPNQYESTLRLHAPGATSDGWWDLYRDLFDLVASVGVRHTATPDLAWFAIWEGHGFDTSTSCIAWSDPPADEAERQWREEQRERRRVADRERNARIGQALASVPRFDLPDRAYYLTHAPLSAVSEVRYPGDHGWRNPDLFWPDDRSWFAATDVDFWSLYVGGSVDFTSELANRVSTPCEFVDHGDRLPIED